MPISSPVEFRRVDEEEFQRRAYDVMGLVFEVHNELGPDFFREQIYRDAIAMGAKDVGFKAETEVPIKVTYGNYSKQYFIDLLIENSVLFEVKVAESIHTAHRTQALNYLQLTGLAHGKIVNMRAPSVEHEFVSTSVTPSDRYDFRVADHQWKNLDSDSQRFRELMLDLVNEWGTFLELPLYCDAIEHILGGSERAVRNIRIRSRNREIGRQPARVLNSHTAFKITALTKQIKDYRRRLKRLLGMADLRAIQWINFNHAEVTFQTVLPD